MIKEIIAILCITGLVALAMTLGYDGKGLALALLVIGGICGYGIDKVVRKLF